MASASGSRILELPKRVLSELARHAAQSWPEECCGILLGSETVPARVNVHLAMAAHNSSGERDRKFVVWPPAILKAQRTARADGLEIVGYYHSHPGGSARPSKVDRRDAWPGTSYVILGMEGRELISTRSWRLDAEGAAFVEEIVATGTDTR